MLRPSGLPAHVFMPKDVPPMFQVECKELGASVTLVDGLINDCGVKVREGAAKYGWFDVSTLKEPYRIEGKKTMGYELAEQLDWTLPDVIIYPPAAVRDWWACGKRLTMNDGVNRCQAPAHGHCAKHGLRADGTRLQQEDEFAELWQGAKTIADGLRVPVAVGDFLILQALRASHGTAIAVTDDAHPCPRNGQIDRHLPCTRGFGLSSGSNSFIRDGLDQAR